MTTLDSKRRCSVEHIKRQTCAQAKRPWAGPSRPKSGCSEITEPENGVPIGLPTLLCYPKIRDSPFRPLPSFPLPSLPLFLPFFSIPFSFSPSPFPTIFPFPSSPSPSSLFPPYPLPLPFPFLQFPLWGPYTCPLNPARGYEERCKLPQRVWAEPGR